MILCCILIFLGVLCHSYKWNSTSNCPVDVGWVCTRWESALTEHLITQIVHLLIFIVCHHNRCVQHRQFQSPVHHHRLRTIWLHGVVQPQCVQWCMSECLTEITECPVFVRCHTAVLHLQTVADFVPNTSDDEGRYSIGAQANVGLFNLEKLLGALSPVLSNKQQKE